MSAIYFRTFAYNWNILIYIGVYQIFCLFGWIHAFCAKSVSRDNRDLTKLRRQRECRNNIRIWAKQQLCTCIALSCTFLCSPYTTMTWNDQILILLENGNSKAVNSTISVWTRARSPLFSSNLNSLILSNRVTWENRGKVWKGAKSIFQLRFHGRRRCRIVKSFFSRDTKVSALSWLRDVAWLWSILRRHIVQAVNVRNIISLYPEVHLLLQTAV